MDSINNKGENMTQETLNENKVLFPEQLYGHMAPATNKRELNRRFWALQYVISDSLHLKNVAIEASARAAIETEIEKAPDIATQSKSIQMYLAERALVAADSETQQVTDGS